MTYVPSHYYPFPSYYPPVPRPAPSPADHPASRVNISIGKADPDSDQSLESDDDESVVHVRTLFGWAHKTLGFRLKTQNCGPQSFTPQLPRSVASPTPRARCSNGRGTALCFATSTVSREAKLPPSRLTAGNSRTSLPITPLAVRLPSALTAPGPRVDMPGALPPDRALYIILAMALPFLLRLARQEEKISSSHVGWVDMLPLATPDIPEASRSMASQGTPSSILDRRTRNRRDLNNTHTTLACPPASRRASPPTK
ncbi:hypothetical protein N7468_005750 [Penicillium chermesinum]|uniref:Uncharacterized protein n=1 Tax=Penicillium chermesinum TaxID=63820 RepID=A0A9W9TQ00_9EURO|nr:uncharacterized protein N7468_005750 [Penicillium chermesinum]KAJ5232794.1 hypothetical protein N7468_005750 [Penicillium chermesinum]